MKVNGKVICPMDKVELILKMVHIILESLRIMSKMARGSIMTFRIRGYFNSTIPMAIWRRRSPNRQLFPGRRSSRRWFLIRKGSTVMILTTSKSRTLRLRNFKSVF